jgi:hypothetical protein
MQSWILTPSILAFALVAIGCFVQLLQAHRQLRKDPDASSAGTEMRRRVQFLLLVANTSR